jgi:phosphate starvation-inducible PhoH-like protein
MSRKPKTRDPEARSKAAEKFAHERERPPLNPKTPNQKLYLQSLRDQESPVVIATGCAGSGKTFIPCTHAADLMLTSPHECSKIVLCRANIPTGRSLGAFKGDADEKLSNWLMPMIDCIRTRMGANRYENLRSSHQIEYQPLETIRGRSFDNAYIIVDEAQQLTIDEVKAITTRLGENSKLVLMGDLAQSDIKHDSGLGKLAHLTKKHCLPIPIIEFTTDDIVRSDACAMFVKLYHEEGI